ncbi:MAG: glycosyltransferase family 4 protein [Gammaproteobacteria bacterium]|nr:glycosyltransferase family 4 protein [Gammaproteobacteria bacterium]
MVITSDDEHAHALVREGVVLEVISFNRGGFNFFRDILAFIGLLSIYRRHKPNLVHHFHAKPVIIGTLAARIAGNKNCLIVNTITGLGHAFIAGGWTRKLAGLGYKIALRKASLTIFQNRDDQSLFIENQWVQDNRTRLIIGSGVDSEKFVPGEKITPSNGGLRILMVGRLLWQKGVKEFVEAARVLKADFPTASFEIAGEQDPVHPDSIPMSYLEQCRQDGIISYIGYLNRLEDELKSVDLFVLPSYREGVPRVVLEASAAGVPCVGADVPGTREVIDNGKTGFLVPVKDSAALAEAMRKLMLDSTLRVQMGKFARESVKNNFDIRAITRKQLELYNDLNLWSGPQ